MPFTGCFSMQSELCADKATLREQVGAWAALRRGSLGTASGISSRLSGCADSLPPCCVNHNTPCRHSDHLLLSLPFLPLPSLPPQLLDLDSSGISVAPQQKISLPELVAQVGRGGRVICWLEGPVWGCGLCSRPFWQACADPAARPVLITFPMPCPHPVTLQCGDEQSAARLFDQLLTSLAGGAAALCIKPATALGDPALGAMRAASGRDLMIYVKVGRRLLWGAISATTPQLGCELLHYLLALFCWLRPSQPTTFPLARLSVQAVQEWADTIPGAILDSDSSDVPMPLPPPTAFVVEPFVTTEPVQVRS